MTLPKEYISFGVPMIGGLSSSSERNKDASAQRTEPGRWDVYTDWIDLDISSS